MKNRPANAANDRPSHALPESPRHDELRAVLLALYARLVRSHQPLDQLIAGFLRRHAVFRRATGFLAPTAYALLRKRYRTLLLWNWAGQAEPTESWTEPGVPPASLGPYEEGALALYRWMREDLGAPSAKAMRLTLAALDLLERGLLDKPAPPAPIAAAEETATGDDAEGTADMMAPEVVADDPTLNPEAVDDALAALPEDAAAPRPPLVPPRPDGAACQQMLRALDRRWSSKTDPLAAAPDLLRDAAELSMPWDLLERWQARFGREGAQKLALALNQPAPLDLRVNTLVTTRVDLQSALKREGHKSLTTPWAPQCLRIPYKANLFRTEAFAGGAFEVQDEGSQVVSLLLDPHPQWRVLDACAGGGGKSLHLAALMRNRGEIFSHDRHAGRLEASRKRLRRAKVHNVRLITSLADGPETYDAVLIDAPCLGLGTLRRNPDLAWRGPLSQRLAEITRLQLECLLEYAPRVRPGGVLVYAVCSFEPEETTQLLDHPEFRALGFEPEAAVPFLEARNISLPRRFQTPEGYLYLLPHEAQTDGFFMARLIRRKTQA